MLKNNEILPPIETFRTKILRLKSMCQGELSTHQRAEAFDAFLGYIADGPRTGKWPGKRDPNATLRKSQIADDLETALAWADSQIRG